MNQLAYQLAILATCAAFSAQAGDNPPPALLAKIQLATQAIDGGNGGVSAKKVGSLDVSKLGHHSDIGQKAQIELNEANSPRPPAAIGGAVGGHASEDNKD